VSAARVSGAVLARVAGASLLVALLALAGCGSVPVAPGGGKGASSGGKSATDASRARGGAAGRGGAYYLDDGPGDNPPSDLLAVPDAVPRVEPLHPFANRPYRVFGVEYVPRPDLTEHRERGVASWYGRKFHGRRTSSGEPYDMYAMTAAHPTLPIPSYVRVTHVRNGRSVVVRVNDRGPFLHRRVIDLSYTAAYRLGYVDDGHAEVEVELLSSPSGPGRGPSPMPAPADVARATGRAEPTRAQGPSEAARTSARATASAPPAPVEPAAPAPMLAEAVAVERLSFETLIDDRPPAPPASASAASASASGSAASASAASASASGSAASASVASAPAAVLASAASAPVAAAPTASRAAQASGTWLQIGAFASRGNAEAVRARFSREVPWLAVPVDVLRQGDTWRVQAGPWTSREDALAVAARIASNGAFRPIPVVR
jgi:rare lipoprotein A